MLVSDRASPSRYSDDEERHMITVYLMETEYRPDWMTAFEDGPPPNMKTCTSDEALSHVSLYPPSMWVYHTWHDKDTMLLQEAVLLVTDTSARKGYGWLRGVRNNVGVVSEFFRWSVCDHNYTQEQVAVCVTRHTCTKCGHEYDVDSSG